MTRQQVLTGLVLEEEALTVEEVAHACGAENEWVLQRVATGVLTCVVAGPTPRFASHDLQRARRIRALERDFEADPELAAMVADLIDEVERLRTRLRRAGLSPE